MGILKTKRTKNTKKKSVNILKAAKMVQGTFKKINIENLSEFLTNCGAAEYLEKINATTLTTKITVEGSDWTIERIRPESTVKNVFKSGDVVDFNTIKPGYIAKCKTDVTDNVLTIAGVDKEYHYTAQMVDGKLKEVVTIKGVSATRWSEKI